jgi:5-methylcytosine-specific restriction endonuclease McrA
VPMMRLCSGVPGVRSCGKLIPQGSRSSSGYKCPECRRETERNKSRRRQRTPSERQRRHKLIEQHVAQYGWVCPGYGCEPHESRDLTADHVIPVARGGNEEGGELRVLCRSCNGRRGAASPRSGVPVAVLPSNARNKLVKIRGVQSENEADDPLVA